MGCLVTTTKPQAQAAASSVSRRDPALSPLIVFAVVLSPTASITLQVRKNDSADKYAISGWGQLHLTVFIFEL